jgi:hypothetical protein
LLGYTLRIRNVVIANVFIYDTNSPGSKTQGYGVYEDVFSNYNIIVNNVVSGNAVQGIRVIDPHSCSR